MLRRIGHCLLLALLLSTACSDDSPGSRDQGRDAGDAAGDLTPDGQLDTGDDRGPGDVTADLDPSDTVDEQGADLGDDDTGDVAHTDLATADASADLALDVGADTAADVSADPALDAGGDLATDLAALTPPLPGFGAISGECDFLDDDEWDATTTPFVFVNRIDFGDDPYDEGDYDRLTDGGREIIDDGNLNPGSLMSEVFAYEVLARCERAELLATEDEVTYADPDGPKTDFVARIDDRQIGVSVTRAHPFDNPFDAARAQELLEDKLQGVLSSTANVTGDDVWVRQILHVVAADQGRVDALLTAFPLISSEIRSNTILVITRGDGDDSPIW